MPIAVACRPISQPFSRPLTPPLLPLPPPLPPLPPTPQAALHGYQLDKAHKFAATLFDECERLAHVSEAYTEPEERVYTPGENLLVSWEGGREQVGGDCGHGWTW